jgi:thiosulfate dehydrogenase (quinone) large subunit
MNTKSGPTATVLSPWRAKGIAILRIVFGLVWAVDAWFKWQPSFIDNLTSYLTGALSGQSPQIRAWIHFWHHVVGIDPRLFGYLTAIGETFLAVALILGAFMGLSTVLGVVLSVGIWTTAEGFGGPYAAGSTDIGAAIMYALVFAGLYLAQAGLIWGLDRRLTPALGNWGWLASGTFHLRSRTHRARSPGHPQFPSTK